MNNKRRESALNNNTFSTDKSTKLYTQSSSNFLDDAPIGHRQQNNKKENKQ